MKSAESVAPQWSELAEPTEIAKALIDLYRLRGNDMYDEAVTQTVHALQCASLALMSGADDTTVVAALLHDLGHLLIPDERGSDTDRRHEAVASRFLSRWFGPNVLQPIALHVAAKRYLCAVEPDYFGMLSPASVRSLELQGGPMNAEEMMGFEALEFHAVAVELRRWDDLGKTPNAPTPGLGIFGQIVEDVLSNR
jgi:phosphonate degradation associated HDIG domain protein